MDTVASPGRDQRKKIEFLPLINQQTTSLYLPNTVNPLEEYWTILFNFAMARVTKMEWMAEPEPLLLNQYLHTKIHEMTWNGTVL